MELIQWMIKLILMLFVNLTYIFVISEAEFMTVEVGTDVKIPCGSISNPFPLDASRIYWYHSNFVSFTNRIFYFRFDTKYIQYYFGYSKKVYDYDVSSKAIIIRSVQIGAPTRYLCEPFGSASDFFGLSTIFIAVPPDSLTFVTTNPNYEGERVHASCYTSLSRPGKTAMSFKFLVNNKELTVADSNLVESTPDAKGLVQVTYSAWVVFHRINTGQSLVCETTWKNGTLEKVVKSSEIVLSIYFPPTKVEFTLRSADSVKTQRRKKLTCLVSYVNPPSDISVKWQGRTINGGLVNNQPDLVIEGGEKEYDGFLVAFSYNFTASREDNGYNYSCTPVWRGNPIEALKKNVTLNVTYPNNADVVIFNSTNDDFMEGRSANLSCNTFGGNPLSIYLYQWAVRYKYGINKGRIQILRGEIAKRLLIRNLQFSDSGEYLCIATSIGGSGSGSIDLFVKYTPMELRASLSSVTDSSVGEITIMNVTVMTYPEITIKDVKLMYNSEMLNKSVTVTHLQGEIDQYIIQTTVVPKSKTDFGIYVIALSNNVGPIVKIALELRERGPPEAPEKVEVNLSSHDTVVISWRSGYSGGYEQIFQIHYKLYNTNSFLIGDDLMDPGFGKNINYTFSHLMANTQYVFKVVVVNENINKDQNNAETKLYFITTPASNVSLSGTASINTISVISGSLAGLIGLIIICVVVVIFVRCRHKMLIVCQKDNGNNPDIQDMPGPVYENEVDLSKQSPEAGFYQDINVDSAEKKKEIPVYMQLEKV